jgi:DNA-binding transcriptional LysR family regulator
MDALNLRQVETFYWVVKLGSFQAAADHLHTTQPGVSARVRQLERTLGVELFDRSARSARLTARGRDLVDYATSLLTLSREIKQRVADRAALTGLVRLGVADTIALTWLPDLLVILAERYPGLAIELEIDLTVNLLRLLREHRIDLAFLVGPVSDLDVTVEPLGTVELAWMAHPDLPVGRAPQSARELSRFPLITHTRGSHQHVMIERWFREEGARPGRISSCSSLATIIRLTTARVGISVLAPATVKDEMAAGRLRIIRTRRPLQPNHFVTAYPTTSLIAAAPIIAEVAHGLARAHGAFRQAG